MNNTKVKINFKTGEMELEGTEIFVQAQLEKLDVIVSLMGQFSEITEEEAVEEAVTEAEEEKLLKTGEQGLEIPGTFGEWLHKFKGDLSDSDKALITAYYVQKQNEGNDFKTSDVNKSLIDHSIKISNPSQVLRRLSSSSKKYVFQTRKIGKLKYLRVSSDGVDHLKALLNQKKTE
ncbi:MAG: hypothetical protein IT362_11150 [Deltaproteobacteria bacterium]|nr:hypothetical protein [Deltaproteobacteria bacterium]